MPAATRVADRSSQAVQRPRCYRLTTLPVGRDQAPEPLSRQLASKPSDEAVLETVWTLDGRRKVPPCALENLVTGPLYTPEWKGFGSLGDRRFAPAGCGPIVGVVARRDGHASERGHDRGQRQVAGDEWHISPDYGHEPRRVQPPAERRLVPALNVLKPGAAKLAPRHESLTRRFPQHARAAASRP